MKKIWLLLGLLGLAGCVPSLQPLYTPDTLTFDSALLGGWAETNSTARWEFTQRGSNEYHLVYTDKEGRTGGLKAHLVQVGTQRFLDLYPDDSELKLNSLYRVHLLPVHTFLWVKQMGPELQMAMMDPDWLKKHLEAHPSALKHENVEDSFVLTAQPKELQAFLTQHVDKVFAPVEALRKIPAAGGAAPAKPPLP